MGQTGKRAAGVHWVMIPALAGLVACAPDAPYNAPIFPFAASYRAEPSGAPVLLDNAEWWRRFNDPVLDELMALALRDSLSIAEARERVIEAQAELGRVPDPVMIDSSVRGGVQRDEQEDTNGRGEASLGFSWMFDPYGERREQLKAAGARIEAADAEADAARLLVMFNLANAYVELRYRQRLLQLNRQELESRQKTLEMTERLVAGNAATRLDITRSQARVAEIQSQIPASEAAIKAKENEIAVLAGRAPGTLPVKLHARGGQPRPKMSPQIGIPADLLRNRPDIRIAERLYYAALADVGVARAAQYPRLSLSGSISLNALEGGNGTDYFFGPLLELPTLPGANARAGVAAADSRVRQAHTAWKSTVLNAILEVENALLDYKAVSSSLSAAGRASQLYGEARDLTVEVFTRQDATLGDLIDAEQELAQADNALAEALYQQGISFVALNVRLGSGHAAGKAPPLQN